MAIEISKTNRLSVMELEPLLEDSRNQGILLVQRLVNDWISKKNCFNQEGEVLLMAKDEDRLVGLCGLNIDPYCPVPGLGRVRHLYVLSSKRLEQSDECYLTAQVLIELWVVATRPVDVNGLGWSTKQASNVIEQLLDRFPVVEETSPIFPAWLNLVTQQ